MGEKRVYEVLRNIMADFELTMGPSGCMSINDISTECLEKR